MKRIGAFSLLVVLLVAVGIAMPIQSVLAQDATWCVEENFTLSDGGYTGNISGYERAMWISTWQYKYNIGGMGHSELRIAKTLGSAGHFTYIALTYSTQSNEPVDSVDALNFAVSLSAAGGTDYVASSTIDVTTDNLRIDFFRASANVIINLNKARYEGDGTNPFGTSNCTPGGGGGGGLGTLTRPLTSADEVDEQPLYDQTYMANLATTEYQDYPVYPVFSNGDYQSVSAWSDAPGAKVHALDDGSIISVKPLAYDDCGVGFVSPSTLDIEAAVEVVYTSFKSTTVQPCLVTKFVFPESGASYTDTQYYLDPSNGYIVTIQIGSGAKVEYLVRNANKYVVVGDTITAGCVLGETMPLTSLPVTSINFTQISAVAGLVGIFSGGALSFVATAVSGVTNLAAAFNTSPVVTSSTMGYTAMMAFDEADNRIELASALTVEPTNTDNCNSSGEYKDCLAFNPQFTNAGDGWQASGNVEWTEPGVILDPGESVFTSVNLSSTADYTATAYAQSVNGAASEIRIFLGTHTQRYTAPLEWSSVQIAAEPLGAPDLGTFYTVGVQNTGTAPIEVGSLCVTDGAPNVGPNSCYFNNHTFTQGTSGWDVSTGVAPFDDALNVPDDGTISQNVKLYPLPGGAATYNLVIRGNWWYTGTIDEASSAASVAQIQYEWPAGSGYQNMIPISTTGNLAYGLGSLAFKAEITVSTLTDAVMNIKVNTTSAGDMAVQGITITDACLSTVNGNNFPQQGGGGNIPPIEANCTYVSRPQNDNPAAWLQWHWAKSEQFFKCDMMVLLNKMYTLGKQSFTLAGWQARYTQSSMRVWADWAGKQLFPWFNGQFSNITRSVSNVVSGVGGQVSTSANIVSDVAKFVNMIGNTVKAIVELIRNIVNQVVGLFQFMSDLVGAVIGAFNDTQAIPVPYLPQCQLSPDESVICAGLWVIDNTVLAGPGSAVIPIIVSFGSAHLLLWLVAEIKRVIQAQGQAL